jgi:hypothetical protein
MIEQKNDIIKDLKGEVWKDVVGYEELYMVSNLGRVRGKGKPATNETPFWQIKLLKKDKIHSHSLNKWGYAGVSLYKNGQGKRFQVHRLVAIAFIENAENKLQVNHKNGVKTDNWVENLEWATPSENLKHAFKIGLKKVVKNGLGKTNELNVNSKPIIQKSLNGDFIRKFPSISEANRYFNKPQTNIPAALSGKQTQSCGYKWEYA